MLIDHVSLSAAGTLAVAVVSLFFVLFQFWFFLKTAEFTWSGWGGALSIVTTLFALSVFIQYNTPANHINYTAELIQYSTFVLLVHSLIAFTFSYFEIDSRKYHQYAGILHGFLIIVIWNTNLVAKKSFLFREFSWLKTPYIEPDVGLLGTGILIYSAISTIYVISVWIRFRHREKTGTRTFLTGIAIWTIFAFHDILATLGMKTTQFLMEYGFLGFSISIIFVTVNKYIELRQKLQIEQEKSSKIIAGSPAVICGVKPDGTTTFTNPAGERITGYSAEELTGRNWWRTFHPGDELNYAKKIIRDINSHEVADLEMDLTTKGGEKRILSWNSINRYDEHGKLVEFIGFGNDITKQKQAENELKKHRDNLEELVKERTKDLETIQKELLEKAHKAGMADIATGTLHNVGNILNSIKVSAQFIEKVANKPKILSFKRANDTLRENMDSLEEFMTSNQNGKKLLEYYLKLEEIIFAENDQIKHHVSRLKEMVIAIEEVIVTQQNFARSSSMAEKHDLPEIIDTAITMQSGTIEKNHIYVTKELADIPKVTVQKAKLVHILVNLINNAADAMMDISAERRTLSITADHKDDAVFIKVCDNGQGVSGDKIEKIFSHGFTTKKHGHGFGLHSSANYMREMGGRMWAESKGEGKGTSFILRFPIEDLT